MLEKLKGYWQAFIAVAFAVLSLAFLYERSKLKTADALADNQEDLKKINDIEKQISSNDGKLDSEQSKREEIQKEADAAKSDGSTDATDFLNKR